MLSCARGLGRGYAEPRRERERSAAAKAEVSECFKVHRLLKTDSTHYWADWSNTCPYTIEAVYVMVGFLDRRPPGDGHRRVADVFRAARRPPRDPVQRSGSGF